MPRRHPKEDDKTKGPSPQALAERRERREKRRESKSAAKIRGLLSGRESESLRVDLAELRSRVKSESDPTLQIQIGNVERELARDKEARQKRPSAI